MHIIWQNLNFHVGESKETKTILNNLSGYSQLNEMVAIMGPSGAGKSSLLNILSGFNKKYDGSVTYNNNENLKLFKNQVGYVHQTDLFKENLTVYEHLYYISKLKNIDVKNIDKIMNELNLTNSKDNFIKNLSGGEKKRLSIASELIHNPKILFLDEPTSGLDSFMAKNVINSLKTLKKNMLIILTIHQPSIYIYYSFDKIYLLKNGNLLYFDTPKNSYNYFEIMGFSCPENENIAEYILEIVNNNDIINYNSNQIVEFNKEEDNLNNENEFDINKCFDFNTIYLLFSRNNTQFYRDSFLFKSQIFKNIFMIVVIGFLYFQLDNNENSIQSISGVIYFILINQCFNTIFPTIKAFSDDIQLFKRENNVLYNLFEYYFSKVNGDIIFQIGTPIFLYAPIYYMVGLRSNIVSFSLSTTVLVLSCLSATSLGYLFGAIVDNIDVGLTLMNVVILPLMIGGGFFINVDSIPIYFIWLKYVSFFKYAFENMMIIEWKDKNINCDNSCYLSNGNEVLEFYNIDERYFEFNFFILLFYSILFRTLTYFVLKYKVSKLYQ
tara:strand:- start:8046 stop:9701 length:1656 start_codon:yes stop_codon:yes gene_type:complete